jgi:glycopeptide antibiotics resistance protein
MTFALFLAGSLVVWILPARYRLAGWVIVIIAMVTPWWGLQDHTHWERMRWVPFVSPPVRIRDIAGNIALYVPFGFLYFRRWRAASMQAGVSYALLLSSVTEFSQLFSHGRYPSVQDVLMNVLGASLGIALARVTAGVIARAPGEA